MPTPEAQKERPHIRQCKRLNCGEKTEATLQAPLPVALVTLFGASRCVKFAAGCNDH